MTNSYLPPVVDIVRTGDAVRAETARTGAETARTGAETARTGAETARTGAETARTAAETARDNAQAASASAAASYDAFDDRYLGAKASDPTVDNDGAALITGALYWSTTLNNLRFWSGTIWVPTNSTFTQAVADTRYLQLTGGTLTGGLSGTTGTFTGAVSGTTGTFTGAVSGTTGTFTGAVSGTTGTFSGVVSGAAATADGHLLNRLTADGRYATPASVALKLDATHAGTGGGAHANATTSVAGFMSGTDKTKLDAVPTPANIWHTGNLTPANYLPLTGGTLTGQLTITYAGPVIAMNSTWGLRSLHAAGGLIGFLSSGGGWTSYTDNTGNFTAIGNVTAFSDPRLKTDLAQISGALQKVSLLTGYTYERIDTGERQVGLLSTDVEAVVPEAVQKGGEYDAVNYGGLVGLLVEAIKELTARVEQLERAR
jgi:hypothetical protein